MGQLIYTAITSLDGYVEDRSGSFDWAMPDDELHGYINNLERSNSTHLYGRLLYETMQAWEQFYTQADLPHVAREYAAIWHAADKVVFSRTLDHVGTARTRIERVFDPQLIRRMKAESSSNLTVGGAQLAGVALNAGLVEEINLFVFPRIVGGGKPALPAMGSRTLELLGEHRFGSGVVHLRYAVKKS